MLLASISLTYLSHYLGSKTINSEGGNMWVTNWGIDLCQAQHQLSCFLCSECFPSFKDLCFIFQRFSLKILRDFLCQFLRGKKIFFKLVRILSEIDWYHYHSANAAPTAIKRHRIKTDQFWRSVTSEPTVPPCRE